MNLINNQDDILLIFQLLQHTFQDIWAMIDVISNLVNAILSLVLPISRRQPRTYKNIVYGEEKIIFFLILLPYLTSGIVWK